MHLLTSVPGVNIYQAYPVGEVLGKEFKGEQKFQSPSYDLEGSWFLPLSPSFFSVFSSPLSFLSFSLSFIFLPLFPSSAKHISCREDTAMDGIGTTQELGLKTSSATH